MASARKALKYYFPNIRFSSEMETEAIGRGLLTPFSNQVASFETVQSIENIRAILKQIERDHGRLPEDKAQGIVKLDIDLLRYDNFVLKTDDMKNSHVKRGMKSLGLP